MKRAFWIACKEEIKTCVYCYSNMTIIPMQKTHLQQSTIKICSIACLIESCMYSERWGNAWSSNLKGSSTPICPFSKSNRAKGILLVPKLLLIHSFIFLLHFLVRVSVAAGWERVQTSLSPATDFMSSWVVWFPRCSQPIVKYNLEGHAWWSTTRSWFELVILWILKINFFTPCHPWIVRFISIIESKPRNPEEEPHFHVSIQDLNLSVATQR